MTSSDSVTTETFVQLLNGCGVDSSILTERSRSELDQAGYSVLPGILERASLAAVRDAVERAAAAGGESEDGSGTRHIEPGFGDATFDRVLLEPRLLAAAWSVLRRPFRLFQWHARDPRPGYGRQGLHADWLAGTPGEPPAALTVLVLLDDFTASNGSTRVVPGSHRAMRPVPRVLQPPSAAHPDEVRIEAEAGSVLVFNAHLWHAGTRNDSSSTRRVLQGQWVALDRIPPGQELSLPDRLQGAVRRLLGGDGA